ncbi:MAG: thioredoxin family protein [Bacteroidia bacterium]|jgi:peroxiredoxin
MNIGDLLIPFSLLNTDGKMVSTFDFSDKYAFVIFVTCNHCPYSQAYWNRLIKMAQKYEEDNLGMIALCGNDEIKYPQDSFENMKSLAKQKKLPFPYLYDETQEVLQHLGALKTPEVFLFNQRRELVYRGAIDDCWDNEATVTHVYLEDAIEYALDGLEIDYPEIPAVGCSIKWKD